MGRLSKWDLDEEQTRELIGQLWDGITLLESKNEVRKFFSKFFTPTEIQMFAKRLELLKLADSDMEIDQIKKLLHLAKTTVYEWLEKHDAYEENFHIVTDKLERLEQQKADREKKRIEKFTELRHPRQPQALESIKAVALDIATGYKKRMKRKSVLKDAE